MEPVAHTKRRQRRRDGRKNRKDDAEWVPLIERRADRVRGWDRIRNGAADADNDDQHGDGEEDDRSEAAVMMERVRHRVCGSRCDWTVASAGLEDLVPERSRARPGGLSPIEEVHGVRGARTASVGRSADAYMGLALRGVVLRFAFGRVRGVPTAVVAPVVAPDPGDVPGMTRRELASTPFDAATAAIMARALAELGPSPEAAFWDCVAFSDALVASLADGRASFPIAARMLDWATLAFAGPPALGVDRHDPRDGAIMAEVRALFALTECERGPRSSAARRCAVASETGLLGPHVLANEDAVACDRGDSGPSTAKRVADRACALC